MAVGDALAVALLERRGFRHDDFAALHPAGRLGKKLLRVEHLMHAGEALPRVSEGTSMPDVFHEMSKKGLGMTTVLQADGRLAGIITDGDLRRLMEKHRGATLEMTAAACMTRNPQTIGPQVLASEALNLMEKRKITSIVVVVMEKHRGATLEMTAGACMTRNPQTIGPQVLASEALNWMEKRKITSIVVVDEAGGVLGVVHLHDLWGLELI